MAITHPRTYITICAVLFLALTTAAGALATAIFGAVWCLIFLICFWTSLPGALVFVQTLTFCGCGAGMLTGIVLMLMDWDDFVRTMRREK